MKLRLSSASALAVVCASLMIGAAIVPAGAATPSQAKGSVVIGVIANATGPGVIGGGAFSVMQAWAKDVNSRGGVNGFKVVVKTADEGSDPAKASAAMKTLIETDHAIAIVGPYAGATTAVWLPIASAAGVPVINGACYSSNFNSDQNAFCVTTTAILAGLTGQAKNAADYGVKKFGITYDASQAQAAAAAPLFKGAATKFGMEWSDGLALSNTAPDYTAACLTFKQSTTDGIGIEGAPPLSNFARDCARQSYSPTWISGDGQISTNSWLKDPNIKVVIANVLSFPYNTNSTPATKRFTSVIKKYAPSVLKSDFKQASTHVWTAAIAFEKALGKVTAAEPTSADITAAMNSFSGETLDGLAPNPLTFTAGQPHPANPCWWSMVLKNHKLTAPDGMKTTCTP